MGNFVSFVREKIGTKSNFFFIFGLALLCWFFYFNGLGDYRLIDIDETRYINIAQNMFYSKDYITPYLNFEPFLEKPPLFYWLVVLSYKIFGVVDNFTSRLPLAISATFGVFTIYFFVLNIVKSRVCAFLAALILMSSFWYALFAHIGIMDLGFSVLTMAAFCFGTLTLFVDNVWKKRILWYLGYFFLALSVLQKGLIGIIVPGGSLLITFLILKKAKEIIKPSHIIPGVLIFLMIAAPWHYLVYKANCEIWFREYILKHHFARFVDSSMGLNRKRPLLFYIPVILGGIMPYTFVLVAAIIKWAKYAIKTVRNAKTVKPLFSADTDDRKLVLISAVWFFVIFLFFSVSSTKLPTYILTAFPPLSILIGYFMWGYIKEEKNKKYVEISAIITFLIFMISGIFGAWFYLSGNINVGLPLAVLFAVFPVFGFIFLKFKQRIWLFGVFIALSFSLCAVNSSALFNFVTSFGQNEIEEYAQFVNGKKEDTKLVTFDFSKKYSILNYYKKNKVIYLLGSKDVLYSEFNRVLKEAKLNKETVYIILRNKKISGYSPEFLKMLKQVKKDKKYSLYRI